jgi:hypothetical protein
VYLTSLLSFPAASAQAFTFFISVQKIIFFLAFKSCQESCHRRRAACVLSISAWVNFSLLAFEQGSDRGFPHTQDTTGACARIDVWDDGQKSCAAAGMIGIEATSSVGESASAGKHTDSPPPSPTHAPALCFPSSSRGVTGDDTAKAAQRDLWRTRSPQLQSIYGLWSTCTCAPCDVDDVRITPLPTAAWWCFDGDIFGVGKRPVQHEIETDGCVRLVFVGVDEIVEGA